MQGSAALPSSPRADRGEIATTAVGHEQPEFYNAFSRARQPAQLPAKKIDGGAGLGTEGSLKPSCSATSSDIAQDVGIVGGMDDSRTGVTQAGPTSAGSASAASGAPHTGDDVRRQLWRASAGAAVNEGGRAAAAESIRTPAAAALPAALSAAAAAAAAAAPQLTTSAHAIAAMFRQVMPSTQREQHPAAAASFGVPLPGAHPSDPAHAASAPLPPFDSSRAAPYTSTLVAAASAAASGRASIPGFYPAPSSAGSYAYSAANSSAGPSAYGSDIGGGGSGLSAGHLRSASAASCGSVGPDAGDVDLFSRSCSVASASGGGRLFLGVRKNSVASYTSQSAGAVVAAAEPGSGPRAGVGGSKGLPHPQPQGPATAYPYGSVSGAAAAPAAAYPHPSSIAEGGLAAVQHLIDAQQQAALQLQLLQQGAPRNLLPVSHGCVRLPASQTRGPAGAASVAGSVPGSSNSGSGSSSRGPPVMHPVYRAGTLVQHPPQQQLQPLPLHPQHAQQHQHPQQPQSQQQAAPVWEHLVSGPSGRTFVQGFMSPPYPPYAAAAGRLDGFAPATAPAAPQASVALRPPAAGCTAPVPGQAAPVHAQAAPATLPPFGSASAGLGGTMGGSGAGDAAPAPSTEALLLYITRLEQQQQALQAQVAAQQQVLLLQAEAIAAASADRARGRGEGGSTRGSSRGGSAHTVAAVDASEGQRPPFASAMPRGPSTVPFAPQQEPRGSAQTASRLQQQHGTAASAAGAAAPAVAAIETAAHAPVPVRCPLPLRPNFPAGLAAAAAAAPAPPGAPARAAPTQAADPRYVAHAAASVALARSAARALASADATATAPPPPRRLPASALAADRRGGMASMGLAEATAPEPPPHSAARGLLPAAGAPAGTLASVGAAGGLASAARGRSLSLVARFEPYAAPPGAPPAAKSAGVTMPPPSAARPLPMAGVDASVFPSALSQPIAGPAGGEAARQGAAVGPLPPAHASFALPPPAIAAAAAPQQRTLLHPASSPLAAASQPLHRASAVGGPAPSRLTPPEPPMAAEHPAAAAFSSHAAAAGTYAGVQPPFAAYGTAAVSRLAASAGPAPLVSGISAAGSEAPLWPAPAPPVTPELLAHLRRYSGQPNAPAAHAAFDWLVGAHAAPAPCWEQVLTSARVLLAAASWAGVPAERLFGASEAELSRMLRAYVTRVVAGPTAVDASAAEAGAGAAAEACNAAAGAAAMPAGAAAAGGVTGVASLEEKTDRRGLGARGPLNDSTSHAGRGISSSSSDAGAAAGCALPHGAPASSSSDTFASRTGPAPETAGGVGGGPSAPPRSAGNADGYDAITAALAAGIQSHGAAAPRATGSAPGFRTPASAAHPERRSQIKQSAASATAASMPTAAAAGGASGFAASANPSVAPPDLGSSQSDGAVVGRKRSRRAAAAAAGADVDPAEAMRAPACERGASGDPAQLSGISLSVAIGPGPDSSSGGSGGSADAPPRRSRGRQRRAPERYSDTSFAARRRNSGSTTCSTATSPGGSTFRGPQQDCFSLGLFAHEAAVGEARTAGRQEYSTHAAARTTVGDLAARGGAPRTEDARSPAGLAPYIRLSLRAARPARNAPSAASPAAENSGHGRSAESTFWSVSMPAAGAGGEGAASGPSKRRRTSASSASRGAARHTGAT